MFNPSPQQKAIFDFIEHDTRSLVIEAVAGSGKTTTIVEACKLVPTSSLSIFLAFNKNIATELQTRLPIHIQAKTFHSHCFGALQRSLPKRPKVEGDKVRWILKDFLDEKEFWLYAPYVQKLVGYAKNSGIGIFTDLEDSDQWFTLIDHYSMVSPSEDFDEGKAVMFAQQALAKNNEELWRVDFDDMLYLALLKKATFDKCNFVFVDEAQDTNTVQRHLLKMMLAPNGRLIAVGDNHQGIYAFRGAGMDALDDIQKEFDCIKMPLSFSYRCPRVVVMEARQYVSHIESHPNAPEGQLVRRMSEFSETSFTPSEVILCRVNAPLVGMAFAFIKRGKGVRILGREIGQGLIALVKKMNSSDLDTMLTKLEIYRRREYDKLMRKQQDGLAEALNDRCECIKIFADALDEDSRTIKNLVDSIDRLFNDQQNGGLLTLCSVHKAKGLEWETVNILDFDKYMPSKWAKKDWAKKQETNLIYVAITRAKSTLRYICSGDWKPDQVQTESKPKTKEELVLEQL